MPPSTGPNDALIMVLALTAPVWLPAVVTFVLVLLALKLPAGKTWTFSLAVAAASAILVSGLVLAYLSGAFR